MKLFFLNMGLKGLLTFVSGGKEFDTNRLPCQYVCSVLCNLKENENINLFKNIFGTLSI